MLINTMEHPYEEFGEDIKRHVRLIVSPQTTGEKNVSLVYTIIQPGGVSEGHVHNDCDEYIYFESEGRAVLDGKETDVPASGVIHAKAGVKHECANTSLEEELRLFCVFTPALKPYGKYESLIPRTNEYLSSL